MTGLWPALFELAILALTAPLLYFPDRVLSLVTKVCKCNAGWLVPVALALLALLWPLRRWLTGKWAASLSARPRWPARLASWALWFWFLVMLPVAIWAAPLPLRQEYPGRAAISSSGVLVSWTVFSHASRSRSALGWAMLGWIGAVQGIAFLAPFGMETRTKVPVIGRIRRT